METKHINNFKKLIKYMKSLPDDYGHFDMGQYWSAKLIVGEGLLAVDSYQVSSPITTCGTFACLLGHAPQAGINVSKGVEHWNDYCYKRFGITSQYDGWNYLFSNRWTKYDNSIEGAIKRMEIYLDLDGDMSSLDVPWEHR